MRWRCSSARRSRRLISRVVRPGADGLAVTVEPDFTGGITGQVSAFGVGEQRAQMQCRGFLLDIDVHHHGGVLPVRAARGFGVPARLDQAHECVDGGRHRGPLTGHAGGFGGVVVQFPLVDQRVPMRGHGGVELGGLERAQGDPVGAARLGGRGNKRAIRLRLKLGVGLGVGFGSRFELDRGTQLRDRRDLRQLHVVLIRSLAGTRGEDPDLIQRQPALTAKPGRSAETRPAGPRSWRWSERSPASNRSSRPPTPAPTAPRCSPTTDRDRSRATISTMRPSTALR